MLHGAPHGPALTRGRAVASLVRCTLLGAALALLVIVHEPSLVSGPVTPNWEHFRLGTASVIEQDTCVAPL